MREDASNPTTATIRRRPRLDRTPPRGRGRGQRAARRACPTRSCRPTSRQRIAAALGARPATAAPAAFPHGSPVTPPRRAPARAAAGRCSRRGARGPHPRRDVLGVGAALVGIVAHGRRRRASASPHRERHDSPPTRADDVGRCQPAATVRRRHAPPHDTDDRLRGLTQVERPRSHRWRRRRWRRERRHAAERGERRRPTAAHGRREPRVGSDRRPRRAARCVDAARRACPAPSRSRSTSAASTAARPRSSCCPTRPTPTKVDVWVVGPTCSDTDDPFPLPLRSGSRAALSRRGNAPHLDSG